MKNLHEKIAVLKRKELETLKEQLEPHFENVENYKELCICENSLDIIFTNGSYDSLHIVYINTDNTFDNKWENVYALTGLNPHNIFKQVGYELEEINVKPVKGSKEQLIKEYENTLNQMKGYEHVKVYGNIPTKFDYSEQIIHDLKENAEYFNLLKSVNYDVKVEHEEEHGYEYCDTHEDVALEDIVPLVYKKNVINGDYIISCLKISIRPTNTEQVYKSFCELYENGEAFLTYSGLTDLIENIKENK